ncbi:CoA protein activase [Anoxybacter fermentans]|uniref:CoA protein activase n=1 Tax=Anoxybacter fermentans TaxID=1323375 RepID=A0A3S9SVI6_9FIRM|nr:CoA protein activase [Anoxybacter fermentans]AZR72317.1 CoA protein activase [Anoxybacter fermentans]
MKKITFPHMGYMNISVKSFLNEMGVEPIEPPPITKKTMDLGVQYAPEFACLPLKVNLGNYLEAIDKGAECILMAGGCGPCRFGYYAEVQREILHDLKKDIEMIVIEPNILSIYQSFKYLAGGHLSLSRLYRILKYVMAKIRAIDKLEKIAQYVRPRSSKPEEVNSRFRYLIKKMEDAASVESIEKVKKEGEEYLQELIDSNHDQVLHVGIVGEIYLLLEPFVNLYIEEKLGLMGVQVHREIFLSHWIDDHVLHRIDRSCYKKAAAPYLNVMIGGHGQETIGRTVLYAREGLDGVIQVAPFTCMPEIVAENILPVVSKKENIPVLSLFFDEHSGEAGVVTRLEAFIDLIRRKSERRVVQL